jgi:hypothetical protein
MIDYTGSCYARMAREQIQNDLEFRELLETFPSLKLKTIETTNQHKDGNSQSKADQERDPS